MYSLLKMFFRLILLLALVLPGCVVDLHAQTERENTIMLQSGTVHFVSDAPLELIEATSTDIRAVIDTVTGKFAFIIPMTSFLGFNSELQRTHFNENYMDSKRFPNATFSGKMIEAWKPTSSTPRSVRAKGKLTIREVGVERLIPATIQTKDGLIHVRAEFVVPVAEHDIKIPRLVGQKIASDINVEIDAWFE